MDGVWCCCQLPFLIRFLPCVYTASQNDIYETSVSDLSPDTHTRSLSVSLLALEATLLMAYPCPSFGNSLTSISSLTTLPPSPQLRPRQSEYGPQNAARTIPVSDQMATKNDSVAPPFHIKKQAAFGAGSVPSPRPRFDHLASSVPDRPRFPRALTSSSVVYAPSPLNPAVRSSLSNSRPINPVECSDPIVFGGSIPQPKPNRLFSSMLSQIPDKLDKPDHEPDQVLSICPAQGEGLSTTCIPETSSTDGEVVLTSTRNDTQHAGPVTISGMADQSNVSDEDDGSSRAPSSLSTFIESMFSPRCVLLLSGLADQTPDQSHLSPSIWVQTRQI